jgi:hypothetical protein
MTHRIRSTIRIEDKNATPVKDAEAVRVALRAAKLSDEPVSAARVMTLTGLPLDHAEQALTMLAATRRCVIDSNEEGELLYQFASLEPATGLVRGGGLLERVWEVARPATSVLFVVGIIAILLVICGVGAYLTAYVSMLESLPILLRGVVGLVCLALFLATAFLFMLPALPFFLLMQVPAQMAAEDGSPFVFLICGLLSLVGLGVYGWLIGERMLEIMGELTGRLFWLGGPPRGPLYDEQRFLVLAQARGGRVRTGDLTALFGWSVDEARAEVTRLLIDYGGDIEVDDDGVIWFIFAHAEGVVAAPKPIWEVEAVSPAEYDSRWGAGTEAMNTQIGALVGLATLAALRWVEPRYKPIHEVFSVPLWLVQGAWWVLAALLVACLLLLALRTMLISARTRQWHAQRGWQLLLEQISAAPGGLWLDAQTPTEWLSDLGAEIDAERTQDGQLWVSFPEL